LISSDLKYEDRRRTRRIAVALRGTKARNAHVGMNLHFWLVEGLVRISIAPNVLKLEKSYIAIGAGEWTQ